MSYESFRKQFVHEVGVSPSRYRAEKRIDAGCDLLQHTRMMNGQIAESLDFRDPFHFSKRFK
jgi:transcriptional regulator GlxA family with amidase domain